MPGNKAWIGAIPKDAELVCVLDSKYNAMQRPQISAFKIPDYDMGAMSMRLLTKMLHEGDEILNKEMELSYVYIPRQTTYSIKKGPLFCRAFFFFVSCFF